MTSLVFGHSDSGISDNTDVTYFPLGNLSLSLNVSTSETTGGVQQVCATAGTFSSWKLRMDTAPGTGNSWTLKIRKNGADTGMEIVISGTATSGEDVTHTFDVTPGDKVSVQSTPSSTPDAPTSAISWSVKFTGSTTKQSTILGSLSANLATGTTEYFAPMGCVTVNATEALVSQMFTTAGTLTNFYGALRTAPGAAKSRAFKVYLNGSGTTQTFTISNTDTTGNDTAHPITVAAGDVISVECIPSGTPAASNFLYGFTFTATTDGHFPLVGGRVAGATANATRYMGVPYGTQTAWDTAEGDVQIYFQACTLSLLYTKVVTAPGLTQSWVYRMRKNAGDLNLTCTISDTATSANDTSNSDSIADADLIAIRCVGSLTAAAMGGNQWGVDAFITPAASFSRAPTFFAVM